MNTEQGTALGETMSTLNRETMIKVVRKKLDDMESSSPLIERSSPSSLTATTLCSCEVEVAR